MDAYNDVLALLSAVNAPVNDKRREPSQSLLMMGVVAETAAGPHVRLGLPADKAHSTALVVALMRIAAHEGVSLPSFLVEKVIGKVGAARDIFPCSAIHMATLYDALHAPQTRPGVDLTLCRADLAWWLRQLVSNTPAKMTVTRAFPSASQLVSSAFSDAGSAGGAVMTVGSAVALAVAPRADANAKLIAVEQALRRYGHLLSGLTLSCGSPDGALINSLNSGSIRDEAARPQLMAVLHLAADLDVRVLGARRSAAASVVAVPAGFLRA